MIKRFFGWVSSWVPEDAFPLCCGMTPTAQTPDIERGIAAAMIAQQSNVAGLDRTVLRSDVPPHE
jgi:hypothetical protein